MGRHKWGKKPHRRCHEQTCEKCGCVKDTSALYYTEYTMPSGESFAHKAPPCIEKGGANEN